MIFGLLGSIVAELLMRPLGTLALVMVLAAWIVAIVGVVRTTGALGRWIPARVIYAIVMLVPVLSLIAMAVVSAQATKALRAGGWRVGFFGARPRSA
jgi:hypothetical protein